MKRSFDCARLRHMAIPLLMLILTATPLWGRILLEENWAAGTVDPTRWTLGSSRGGEWVLVDLGGGDYALRGHAAAQPDTSLMSKLVFFRAKNLRVTFKLWGDPTKACNGKTFPEKSTVIAPWHSSFYDYCQGFTLEAGLKFGRLFK